MFYVTRIFHRQDYFFFGLSAQYFESETGSDPVRFLFRKLIVVRNFHNSADMLTRKNNIELFNDKKSIKIHYEIVERS